MTNGGSSSAGRGAPSAQMPAVFVSHGSPMVAIETGIYQEAVFSTALYRCAASLSHESTLDKENDYVSQVVYNLR